MPVPTNPVSLHHSLLLFAALFVTTPHAVAVEFDVTVTGTNEETRLVPLKVAVRVEDVDSTIVRLEHGGQSFWGQLTRPSILAAMSEPNDWELHFVMPLVPARQTVRLSARTTSDTPPGFGWSDEKGLHQTLTFGRRRVLRYMHEALDHSSPERTGETYKVYHHLFDPTGARLVTKGPGGKFPHHRGLFFGFNRISYGDKTADIWHCREGEHQAHERFMAVEAGPVVGRHQLSIAWHGKNGEVFVREQRELAVYHVPGGQLIEFASVLEPLVDHVRLDGDPQHAGFQFRGSQDIPDKTQEQTYYLRPDGKAAPGEFRNWTAKRKNGQEPSPADLGHVNLPWNAMSFVLDDQRYTCCYIDHPQNPKPARFSERNYGRFGSYFEYDLDQDHPLRLNYRIWLQTGEMTVDEVAKLGRNFVAAPIARAETLVTN